MDDMSSPKRKLEEAKLVDAQIENDVCTVLYFDFYFIYTYSMMISYMYIYPTDSFYLMFCKCNIFLCCIVDK